MKKITLNQAAQMLRTYFGCEISGGHFDTLQDFAAYYRNHSTNTPFVAEDLAALVDEIENEE